MIGYDVSLSGQKWQKYFGKPQARMIAPYGVTNDAMLAAFSRSITFNKKNDDSCRHSSVGVHANLTRWQSQRMLFVPGILASLTKT